MTERTIMINRLDQATQGKVRSAFGQLFAQADVATQCVLLADPGGLDPSEWTRALSFCFLQDAPLQSRARRRLELLMTEMSFAADMNVPRWRNQEFEDVWMDYRDWLSGWPLYIPARNIFLDGGGNLVIGESPVGGRIVCKRGSAIPLQEAVEAGLVVDTEEDPNLRRPFGGSELHRPPYLTSGFVLQWFLRRVPWGTGRAGYLYEWMRKLRKNASREASSLDEELEDASMFPDDELTKGDFVRSDAMTASAYSEFQKPRVLSQARARLIEAMGMRFESYWLPFLIVFPQMLPPEQAAKVVNCDPSEAMTFVEDLQSHFASSTLWRNGTNTLCGEPEQLLEALRSCGLIWNGGNDLPRFELTLLTTDFTGPEEGFSRTEFASKVLEMPVGTVKPNCKIVKERYVLPLCNSAR